MKKHNPARWAILHKSIIYFFIVAILAAGTWSYFQLGRREDPNFTIRSMIVTAAWPGASAEQMTAQVTDKLEEKLQNTPGLDYIRSYTLNGRSVIYVWLKEDLPADRIRPTWTEVRDLTNEVWRELPKGVVGPFFNDRFDDVYGSIFALTGDQFSYEEKRAYAEKIRRSLLQIPDVQKVKLVGVQEQQLKIEMDEAKLAQLGIDPRQVFQLLQQQGTLMPAGTIRTDTHNISLRVQGLLDDADSIRNLTLHMGERSIRLGDIATVTQGYADPENSMMYYNGKPAVGIAVSMSPGGNVLHLGENLQAKISHWQQQLPLGLEIGEVTNQPEVVNEAIGEFTRTLFEAIGIVLLVSFLALGWRSGMVVALSIPVVVAATFITLHYFGIELQKVSLGALIISLGLLVDDAMIVIEMMQRKLEDGYERIEAATAAYELTAFPMLSGTLITAAGFIPIGLATGIVAEYTHSLFSVTAIALLLSWIVSVLVSPVLGYRIIRLSKHTEGEVHEMAEWRKKLYRHFRKILENVLERRKLVVLLTLVVFVVAVLSYPLLKKELFPASVRPEIIVEMELPLGASLQATKKTTLDFESHFFGDERVKSITSYIGESAPRFILQFDPVPPKDNFAQTVIVATSTQTREELEKEVRKVMEDHFPDVRTNIRLIQTGPPAAYPVMLRLSGPDEKVLADLANQAIGIMRKNPNIYSANMDWPQETPTIRLDIDQSRIRTLGADNYAVASDLYTKLSGYQVTTAYQGDQLVPVYFRLPDTGGKRLGDLENLPIHVGGGRFVPLGQFATLSYANENNTIWRRDLTPTITLRADLATENTPGETVTEELYKKDLAEFRAHLPMGYKLEYDGVTERSHISIEEILKGLPMMSFLILAILMFQLKKITLMAMAAVTAPLGIIGSILMLQLTRNPLGFLAILGIIALSGMIIRNSIILLDQIELHRQKGESIHDAVINSTILRFRPIMLTAMAAILGMIPLMRSSFWGPMAFAFSGGLLVATILTLFFLPALYVLVYKDKE